MRAAIATNPVMHALLRLHAELGGKIKVNRAQARKLAVDMKHVEAVIRMFEPSYDVTSIAAKRRYKSNPWFKRGSIFRGAMDVLRKATAPMTVRQIGEALIAAKGVTVTSKQAENVQAAIRASLRKHDDKSVIDVSEGVPARWILPNLRPESSA